jgi:hypothetical protein
MFQSSRSYFLKLNPAGPNKAMEFIIDTTREEHVARGTSDGSYSATGQVKIVGVVYEYCIWKGDFCWLSKDKVIVKNPSLSDAVFAAWISEFM